MSAHQTGVKRIVRIVLNSADPEKLSRFFVGALGFEIGRATAQSPGGRLLALGDTLLELRPVGAAGRPYPPLVPGWSPLFQHCALITSDMGQSVARLTDFGGSAPISAGGPQRLPAASGGVTAFKFRDPEGHPLEFIAPKPSGAVTPRIDHSAISVAETARSISFYESLGLKLGGHSLNVGVEQGRLDGVPDAVVEVTSLALPSGTAPRVELLCYRGDYDRAVPLPGPDDIAATRLVFAVPDAAMLAGLSGTTNALVRDPDGHLLEFEAAD